MQHIKYTIYLQKIQHFFIFSWEKWYNCNGDDMQNNNETQNLTLFEERFAEFKDELKEDLNIDESLTNDELKQLLTAIIKEYESEFYDNFTDIFIYTYYKNLLNSSNNTMNQILDYVKSKRILDSTGKEKVLKSERADCNDVLYLYGFEYAEDQEKSTFISKITGKKIPTNYQVAEIINNNDIFFRPPKGNPDLRGPHITYSIEYGIDYWTKFKEEISQYITNFEKNHSEEFIEDLKDYRYWLNKYRAFITYLKQENTLLYLKGGESHVKN